MLKPTHLVVPVPPKDRRSPRFAATVATHPVTKGARRVFRSLTAAAYAIKPGERARRNKGESWAEEAWSMYDQVGELHYSANVQASAVGALVLVPTRTDQAGEDTSLDDLLPEAQSASDKLVLDVLSALGGDSPTGLESIQKALGIHLFITGEGYLVGLPPIEYDEAGKVLSFRPIDDYALTELTWRVFSSQEASEKSDKYVFDGVEYPAASVRVICVKRPHPLDSAYSDSPVRSAMPILRELVGLTMHIGASIDSRLAGAGALFVPKSATALGIVPPEDGEEPMDLVDAFIEAAVTAIKDRDNASALVPIVITVPDDCGFQPFHLSFSTPLDAAAKDLRDEAIRRLALALDQPPEVLLGLGESSHWNAWAIQEDNVRLHVVPTGSIIADALTRFYLRPALVQLGMAEDVALTYWLNVSADDLVERPNRTPEAIQLHAAGVLSDQALRDAASFSAEDAPEVKDVDEAVTTALDMLRNAPSLAQDPGLPALVAQLRLVLSGGDATTTDDPANDPSQVETEEVEAPAEQGPPGDGEAPDPR